MILQSSRGQVENEIANKTRELNTTQKKMNEANDAKESVDEAVTEVENVTGSNLRKRREIDNCTSFGVTLDSLISALQGDQHVLAKTYAENIK